MRPPCASPEKSSAGTRPPHGPPTQSPTGTRKGAAWCAIAALAALIDDAVGRLEAPHGAEPAARLVPGCNAALEACLELMRDASERDRLVHIATDDLTRLARLLKLIDGPDIPFILRQIRRVLGRFDACGGNLVIDGDS